MKWLRRGAAVIGILLAIPVVLFVVVLGAIQVPAVQSWLAGQAASLTAGTDYQVQMTGLGGYLPFAPEIGHLQVADQQGVWLEVDGARLDVAWTDLLSGHIHVRDLSAERVAVLRTPVSSAPPPPPEPFSLPDPTSLPASIPAVSLDRLQVDRIELAEPILGEPMVLALGGSLSAEDGSTAHTDLDLHRVDRPDLALTLNGVVDLAARRLNLDVSANEAGGLVAKLAGLPQAGELHLDLKGNGPLDNWQGKLNVDLANVVAADADLKLGIAKDAVVGIDAVVHPAEGILPAGTLPVIGRDPKLTLVGRLKSDGSIALDKLDVGLAAANLSGSAQIPAGSGALKGTIVADVPDLAPLSELATTPLQGALQAKVTLGGTRDQPAAGLHLDGSGLGYQRYQLAKLATDLHLVANSPLGEPLAGADFKVNLEADGLDVADMTLPDDGPITLDAEGSARTNGQISIATLAASGLGASLTGKADVETTDLAGSGTVSANVPSLSKLAAFLPPSWRGLEGQLALDAQLASTAPGGGDAKSNIQLHLSDLAGIPDQFKALVGDRVDVAADAVVSGGRRIAVDKLTAETAAVELDGNGKIDLDGGPLEASLDGRLADLGNVSALAGLPLSGSVTLTARADGTLAAPNAALSLDVAELGGLPEDVGATVGPAPSLDAKASKAADGMLKLDDLSLKTAAAIVTGSGRYAPSTGALSGQVDGRVDDLAFLGRWLGGEPGGHADLQVRADGTLEQPSAHLSLQADDLAGFPQKFADLLGNAASLEARAAVVSEPQGGGRVARLDQLDLKTAAVSLAGSGRFGLDDRTLAADLHGEMPDLQKAAAAASTQLAGALSLDATVRGDLDQPGATLKVRGSKIEAAGRPLGTVTADLDANDLIAAPQGDLAATVMADRDPLTLKTRFSKNDSVLQLSDLSLTGPGRLRLDGGLKLDTAGPSANGKLVGGIQDLGGLQPLVGQALSGSLKLDVRADATKGQSAKATVNGSSIAVPGVIEIGSVNLNAALADLLGKPRIDTTLTARNVNRQNVDLPLTTVKANGPLDAVDVTLATDGNAFYPLKLDAATTIRRDGQTMRIDLTKLQGSVADKPLRLQQPARIEIGPAVTALSDLDLRFDQASLSGSAKLAGQRAKGDIRLRDLQLASLEPFGAPPLVGSLTADLGLDGTVGAPKISLDASGKGIGVKGVGADAGAPLDLQLNARTTGKRVDGELDLTGLGNAALTISVDAPLQLVLQPFAVAVPPTGRFAGSMRGELDLAKVALLAALDGQRVEGGLISDLTFGGTLQKPQANGTLRLQNVNFADTSSGAAMRDLNLTVQAEGQRVLLQKLTATDGNSGRLDGSGQADLGSPDLPFSASVSLKDFQPLYRDDLIASIGGKLDLKGDKSAASVVGRFLIDRAEITIPSGGSGGGNIPVIEVNDGSNVEPGAGAAPTKPYQIKLDVVVDMPERIFVRGRGLESEWGGKVTAEGTAAKPVVTGQIAVKRGFINFLDRRFDITKGTVALDGAVPPDPEIDLSASFKTDTITGILNVTGRATDPKLELTSDPALPQDEIMAQILFGRNVSNITPTQGLQLAAALNTLRGGGPGIFDRLRQGLGVDTLDVGGEGANSSVKAGKYLSDNVFLEVQQGVQPGSSKATVEVEVVPNVTVNTEVTEDSQTGFGVQWKYDY